MCGIADPGRVVGDILRHDGSGTDYAPVADGHAGTDGDVGTDPAVLSDLYGGALHLVGAPLRVILWMHGGDEMAVGADLGVVTDRYRCGVEEGAVVVHDHVLSDVDVESEVASEGEDDQ